MSSYGVEFDRTTQQYEWNKFRAFSRLEKKVDETLTEYYKAFYAMCKRVTGKKLNEEEEKLDISVEPVSEDRANRCLARIDLLSKIREEILASPDLDEKLELCQPSIDLPDWWVCCKHDKDLLIGAAKHGLNRLDLNLMHDPELSFREILRQAEIEARNQASESEKVKSSAEDSTVDSQPETKENELMETLKPEEVEGKIELEAHDLGKKAEDDAPVDTIPEKKEVPESETCEKDERVDQALPEIEPEKEAFEIQEQDDKIEVDQESTPDAIPKKSSDESTPFKSDEEIEVVSKIPNGDLTVSETEKMDSPRTPEIPKQMNRKNILS